MEDAGATRDAAGLYEAEDYDAPLIQPMLDDIGLLFYVDELASERGILGTPEHIALRKEMSGPVIEQLFEALDDYNEDAADEPASIAKAIRYIIGQRQFLQRLLKDPTVPIHNNLSERALRVVALLRENALFAGTDDAAQRFAQLLSLLATRQMHGVNPEMWLADVLVAVGEPGLTAADLLPRNRNRTREAEFKPHIDTR